MSANRKPTILLTGATGFLGSHLLRGLCGQGYPVVVSKRSRSDTSRIADLLTEVRVYNVDKTPLRDIFEEQQIEAVIHAATSYGRKGERVSQIVESNLTFPLALLELCLEFNTDTFFNTDTVLPDGLNYYVMAKKQFLDYGLRMAQVHALQFTNIRLEHMYGPSDDESKFIPFLIRAFLSQRQTLDLTAGQQRRDFIYVDDVVAAYLVLLAYRHDLKKPVATVELGTGDAPLIADVVRLTRQLCQSRTELRFGALPYRDGENMHSQADISEMKRFGWSPRVPLREGIALTIRVERERFKR